MGRGRQKAKQTKVARELKYYSPSTDYDALQRELGTHDRHPSAPVDDTDAGRDGDEYDEYADWASNGRH
ncbi:DUF3073 domain-containing protein [Kineosporia sp. J2-2]|uniref:DUF3073 domain-containing protein n=1 Tax=Kineosporia corallincola TaxID=2835133 RepID=A0ABS5TNN4_9ACTN|nr:DUF3073 domain-containing protein [Kineosporia corallincola]MBT0772714.1 DUF3073 domain-containing protein [Kineosporia corallincola]